VPDQGDAAGRGLVIAGDGAPPSGSRTAAATTTVTLPPARTPAPGALPEPTAAGISVTAGPARLAGAGAAWLAGALTRPGMGRTVDHMAELLDSEQVDRAVTELPGWSRQGDQLRAKFTAESFRDAIALVSAVADQAEEMDHHPDIDIRYTTVSLALSTHSAGGITGADVELAGRISRAAAAAGISGG
jgi:4a-hydroxytetrahydrobiopterin dehydratase